MPLQVNPVHSSLVVQLAWPWFCNGNVLFSNFDHIWHSGLSSFIEEFSAPTVGETKVANDNATVTNKIKVVDDRFGREIFCRSMTALSLVKNGTI